MLLKNSINVIITTHVGTGEILKYYQEHLLSALNLYKNQRQPRSLKRDEILSKFICSYSLFKFQTLIALEIG